MRCCGLWCFLLMLSAGFFLFGFCTWAQAQGTLTEAEQNWLDQHNGKIVLGHDPAANPIDFIDKDGKFRGLAADYVRLLEEKLSFKFQIAKIPTWEGVIEQAKERKVDVLCAFSKNPQREKWLLFTDPYLIIPAVIITRNEVKGDLSLVKMTGKKVTFTKGWVIEDYLRKNFDNLVLIPAVNGMAAMDAVSTGQADAWVTALTTASVLIDKFKVTNLRVGGETNFSFKLAMASRKDWPILNRILIKGLSLITPNEKSKILNKWISLRQRSIFENEDFWLNFLLICAVVLGIFGAVVVWNISLRRQVARRTVELEKSRKQLAALFRKSPLWITLSTLEEGVYIDVNDTFTQMTGYRREEVLGRTSIEMNIWDDPGERLRALETAKEQGRLHNFHIDYRSKDGSIRNALWSAETIELDGKLCLISVLRDVTERKIAEKTLAQNQAILDATGRMAKVGGWELDAKNLEVKWTDETYRIHEIPIGSPPSIEEALNFFHPEEREKLSIALNRSLELGESYDMVVRFITANGRPLWTHTICKPIVENNKVIKLIGTFQDITDRKRVEDELRQANERLLLSEKDLRESQRIAHVGSWRLDIASNEVVWSEELYNMYGFDPALPPPPYTEHQKLFTPESWERLSSALSNTIETGNPYELELETVRENGSQGWMWVRGETVLDARGVIVGLWGAAQDITDRKLIEQERVHLESQLRQAQKMEAVGTLAGGIAHDFNNILAAIMGYTEIALEEQKEGKPTQNELRGILQSANRAKNLVQQILTFSHRADTQLKLVDVNHELLVAANLLKQTLPKMVDIRLELSEDVAPVMGDPYQIEQILMNLGTNSRDAMPDGGTLTIATSQQAVADLTCRACAQTFAGDYVVITVTDTGEGMTKESLGRIFEPFFTTKEVGKGTGLGLATIFGIVRSHGGHITCSSEQGKGTTFTVYLPPAEGEVEVQDGDVPDEDIEGGQETILLVDDEAHILHIGSQNLSRAGYEVITAPNGEEALEVFQARANEINLVVLDLSMPGTGGHKCLQELLSLSPDLKVIVSTGYSRDGDLQETMSSGAAALLSKPFSKNEMLKTVRMVLDA